MAELIALGGTVLAVASAAARLWPSKPEKTPLYTLTPPEFDTAKSPLILISTPLESYSYPRKRLFYSHLSDNYLDVSLNLAPPRSVGQTHDFLAHLYLPRARPLRPLAEARFHLQHRSDPNSFVDALLRTEEGGNAMCRGAFNITAAVERLRADQQTSDSIVAPGSATVQKLGAPVGVSAFFNLPLFTRLAPSPSSASASALQQSESWSSFAPPLSLCDQGPMVGLRLDGRNEGVGPQGVGCSSFSLGLHADPRQVSKGLDSQAGGWVSQETDNFRLVAEGRLASLRPGAQVDSGLNLGAEGAPHPASVSSASHAGGVLPPRLRASLPPLLSSRVGLFWTPHRVGPLRPGYEVGAVLSSAGSKQQLSVSYYHHLVVRRNVHNPFEKKENRSINNYIDVGMELVYENDTAVPVSSASALAPPALRFGASWQPNKNSLLKFRLADSQISILGALKSWWDPSATAAVNLSHSLATNKTTVGVSVSLENIGEVLFSKPDPSYRRMVASQRERIENLVEQDENY